MGKFSRLATTLVALATGGAWGADILQTTGFSNCNANDANVTVQRVDISYNADNKTVTFDVAGTSTAVQNVTAVLNVTAYGQQIYSNVFDPCSPGTFVEQLCPVPIGTFSASGTQAIPAQYASLVPAIAFQIPDIAAMATLQLQSKETGQKVACIQSEVSNGKTASVPAVSYVAAGVAGAALVMSGVTAVSAALAGGGAAINGGSAAAAGGAGSGSSGGGMGTVSPSFTEVFGWFQGMAMNGMLSVNYPQVYRSFSKNFGFSTGLVPWTGMQVSIDSFRQATGGNLTQDSVQFLDNATLVFPDGSVDTLANGTGTALVRRAFARMVLLSGRQITTSINGTDTSGGNSSAGALLAGEGMPENVRVAVKGIQAYVEELSIPSANTFMTVLLIVAIVIAAISVSILLVKVILEFWALFGSFPKSLAGFRKHYWGSIARAITNLILLLYGVWVLYCVFQFTQGDSWAAKTLAGVTLGLFTGVLVFFSYKIWSTARKLRKLEGDIGGLYDDKSIWVKYSLFYESYRRDYWWIFVPTIVYMFAKGCVLAGADGHGMVQTIAQLIIEAIMLILLIWSRPYERKSGNVINVIIQVVRVLSVVCILVFVEEFGIAQTTQTVTGVVLIAVQSALTGILAILIAWNAVSACCKENPHRKRRKELEKMQRDTDNLTPLDARNSLLLDRSKSAATSDEDRLSMVKTEYVTTEVKAVPSIIDIEAARPNPLFAPRNSSTAQYRPITPSTPMTMPTSNASRENLVMNAAPMPARDMRQPTLPNINLGAGGQQQPAYGGYRPPPQRTGYGDGYGYGQGGGGGYGQQSGNNGAAYGGGYGGPYGRPPPQRGF